MTIPVESGRKTFARQERPGRKAHIVCSVAPDEIVNSRRDALLQLIRAAEEPLLLTAALALVVVGSLSVGLQSRVICWPWFLAASGPSALLSMSCAISTPATFSAG